MRYPFIQNFVHGQAKASLEKRSLEVISPLDGELLSIVPLSSAKDLDEAVKSAKSVFPSWSKTPIKERVQVFFRYKSLLEKNMQGLASLISEENGKTNA